MSTPSSPDPYATPTGWAPARQPTGGASNAPHPAPPAPDWGLVAQRQQLPLVPTSALASPWTRLGASLLNVVLVIVTLGIGYLVWTLVLWNQGTNPGKKMCGLYVVKADTGRLCTFGDMLVRSVVMGYLVLGLIGTFSLGIGYVVDALMVFGERRQRLVDRMAGTLVVGG